jgi:hypothetical protein
MAWHCQEAQGYSYEKSENITLDPSYRVFFFFLVSEMESRASCMLGKCSTSEPQFFFRWGFFMLHRLYLNSRTRKIFPL